MLFQLSRNLKVASVQLDGAPMEFLQNPAIAGSQTARTNNDVVAVVLPAPLSSAEHELTFQYAGPVMTDTGGGFLYVGDRGTWYPNFGFRNAQFDLRFRVPGPWKLVATGEPVADTDKKELHFRTGRAVPVAGFNVGRFTQAESASSSHSATITAYGTEHGPEELATPLNQIAAQAAETVNFLEEHLGAFPYHVLSVTEVPGGVSQGWPGLVYLSTEAFSAPKLGAEPRTEFARIVFKDLMLPHEIGHQYWGDNVAWRSYREQWTSEALANYCALMLLEQKDSTETATVLSHYRDSLLRPATPDAPVTLGLRLDSSLAPQGYVLLTYGRGTWLIHMLRSMLRDATVLEAQGKTSSDPDAAFWQALKSLQTNYAGGAIGAKDLQSAFEKVLPQSLNFENASSLTWFFEDWVNGTSVPRFTLSDVKIAATGVATGTITTT
jgi:aminopeptidase N